MACDRQYTYSGTTKFLGAPKIVVLEKERSLELFGMPKTLIGFAGSADVWGQVMSFLIGQEDKLPKLRDIDFLMMNANGIYHGTNFKNWMLLNEKHFSIGSGMSFALAAMESGKTPLQACRVASRYDLGTGMGFKEYKL